MNLPIYLDHHATTPVDPEVLETMLPALRGEFGNPASQSHPFGWRAQEIVDEARRTVAAFIGARSASEIIFTSGTTESNNLALKGCLEALRLKTAHVITQTTEHKSVLEPCRYLETKGFQVTYLDVDSTGRVDPGALERAIRPETAILSIMLANNEIGTLQPVEEIGRIAKKREIFFHVDAAQAAGKIPIDVNQMGIDLLSFSAHKMYGPKGVGVLYARSERPRVKLAPLFHGGGHEKGIRSGTLNVPAIAGLAKACEIAGRSMDEENRRVKSLRDRLEKALLAGLGDAFVNGHPQHRLAGNLNISFLYIEPEALMAALQQDLAVSASSACSSGIPEASYVMKALGIDGQRTHTALRFGIGRFNTAEEIDYAAERVIDAVKKLRKLSGLAPGS